MDNIRTAALNGELSRLSREARKRQLKSGLSGAASATAPGGGTTSGGAVSHNWMFHPSLRHPMVWAGQKKFWLFDKTALAETMLLYSDQSLHAALSDAYDAKTAETARAYDSIKGDLDPIKLPERELAPIDPTREALALKWNSQLLAYLQSSNRDLAIPVCFCTCICTLLRSSSSLLTRCVVFS